jgi:hypothetical protein
MRRSRTPDEVRQAPGRVAAADVRRIQVQVKRAPLSVLTIAGAVVSVAAAAVAIAAARSARRLAAPASSVAGIDVDVLDGSVRRELAADLRRYAFTVALANRSSAAKTIAAAGLRVSYRTRANFLGAVDLPLTPGNDPGALRLPLRLLPNETQIRAAQLETSNTIPRHCRVEGYALLFVDDSGNRWTAPASLPQVLKDDHDGDGPKSWGWD